MPYNLYTINPFPESDFRQDISMVKGVFSVLAFASVAGVSLLPSGIASAVPLVAAANIPIVTDGRAVAVIVTEDNPTAVVQYAAQELIYHLTRATGAKFVIVAESAVPASAKTRLYLGDTRAARTAGIHAKTLAPETFVLRTGSNALFIAGKDASGDPMDMKTSAGTLFGVYEWLENTLGVRWEWPGELGTYVPKTRAVAARPINETISPRFFQRNVRAGMGFTSEHPAMGFTPKAAEQYAREQSVFLRRHRLGRSQPTSYGHAFTDWWEKYGTAHPEWFQLVNGKRGPAKEGARFSMSISDLGLQREIVALWKEKGGAKPGPSYLNAVENDILGLCECEQCRALDGPQPTDYATFLSPKSKMYGKPFVSDRYARSWLAIQQLAAKDNPATTVVGYAYMNYFVAPTSGVKLNEHILIGFCPSGWWYPRAPEEHAWVKKQWKGWGDTGAKLFSRTNYFLDGYCMPFIFAHQFADDFQNEARNGMVGTDFDSLTGQWATQGPNLYLLMRLQTHPDAKPDDLLAEYYSAFGPAAAQVKAYFDYWEKYTTDHRAQTNQIFEELDASRWRTWAKAAHKVFPESCFAPGEALLAKAAVAASGDKEALARVQFLQLGLTHAKLCSRVAALLTLSDATATPERGKKALDELLAFRRANEHSGIANFNHESWVEDMSWKLSNETKQQPELYP
jgi:hypothetical protein